MPRRLLLPLLRLAPYLRRLGLSADRVVLTVYLLLAGLLTLWSAQSFFDSRSIQVAWAEAARLASDSPALRNLPRLDWSAPLDDTFIHFDFARSLAHGRPFEWTQDGGYSSGATSWLYPAVLALAIRLGLEGAALGHYADWLACVCVFAFLFSSRALFRSLPPFGGFLLPPVILTSGVLGWSLWSGMELALFLAIWGLAAYAFTEFSSAETDATYRSARRLLSASGLLLVLTRPEALYCVGVFALVGLRVRRQRHDQLVVREFWLLLAPALGLTVARALINLVLTGTFADAGALVKLETLHPFHDSREIAMRWFSHIGFQFSRLTVYHTSSEPFWGFQLWLLALLGLFFRRTRTASALLWLSSLGWILIVAQNEYVRYQNDRYTMPALAWLLIAAALGAAGALAESWDRLRQHRDYAWLPVAAGVVLLSVHFVAEQGPRSAQQRWHFGRACRNILEQQVRVGQLLGAGHYGKTRRVLVGDAGAIPYFSGLPALDAIGLGGTKRLPFSRAVRLGVGATVELIEHLSPEERPDRLAIYPSWWDLLPVWFGRAEDEVRIAGNVICGAANKGIYAADFSSLDPDYSPVLLDSARRVLDEVDFADVLSESAHGYHLSERHAGYVVMKILAHPNEPRRDLFDAGRLAFATTRTRFHLNGLVPGAPVELFFRLAPLTPAHVRVHIDGRSIGELWTSGADEWQEPSLVIPAALVRRTVRVEIEPIGTEYILYHLWAATKPRQ